MPFTTLGLSDPIVKAVTEAGYTQPTAIQEQAIPHVLAGRDLIAAAPTGTGKTASFVLPLLQRFADKTPIRAKRIRALILSPTRELASQLDADIQQYSKYLELGSMAMYGGVDPEPQKQRLIDGVDFLVATPGRLLDMLHQRALHFDELEVLVLDEADKMLDMGFVADINKIIERLPKPRQSLLFSATLSDDVRFLARTAIDDAVEISLGDTSASKPKIEQWLVAVDKGIKSALLSHLIKEQQWQQALIFIETKHGAAKLVGQLEKRGIKAEAFHSGRSQASREQVYNDFKTGELQFLVATGIAARGLDIDNLDRVVNYDLPYDSDEFIHRIGRTGRAGSQGEAVSLLSRDDFKNLCAIESRLGHIIERRVIEGFVPEKEVPVSVLNFVSKNKSGGKARVAKPKSDSSGSPWPSKSPARKSRGSNPKPDKKFSPWDK